MFGAQVRCLEETGSLSGKSLVYSAPTSGGKTLIAEVLALRQALHKNKKAMIVVPFVSVAAEKVRIRAIFLMKDTHAGHYWGHSCRSFFGIFVGHFWRALKRHISLAGSTPTQIV